MGEDGARIDVQDVFGEDGMVVDVEAGRVHEGKVKGSLEFRRANRQALVESKLEGHLPVDNRPTRLVGRF